MLRQLPILFCLAAARLGLGAVVNERLTARGDTPKYPYDPNTSEYCSYWVDITSDNTKCTSLPDQWGISLEDFLRWNPSLAPDCSALTVQHSYCVETYGEPSPTDGGPGSTPSPTTPSNGIDTPQPVQPGMVDNCDAFYFVPKDESCQTIADAHGITLQQFLTWNPKAGSNCAGLWAETYACVSIIGQEPSASPTTTPTATPSPTSPGNGIETPQPTQPSMVDNCDAFYFVPSNEGCQVIADNHGITLQQFLTWNPKAGSNCSGLWANAYACVSIVGHQPATTTTTTTKPTTTAPSNGITTPTPTQPDIVGNCDKFYFVQPEEGCDDIAKKNGISLTQFLTWNPKAGSTCSGLWANAYACVSIIGQEPTPTTTTKPTTTTTKTGNGVTTPTPTQSGMVSNCKTFHFVKSDQTCTTIANLYKITVANIIKWNPGAGSSCNLWANTYACVGLI
ncbi:LysM domain-containing protein [Xylaria flabelliformis]|nr:LysM domain-containing protein [Xylaria flabelliformis]